MICDNTRKCTHFSRLSSRKQPQYANTARYKTMYNLIVFFSTNNLVVSKLEKPDVRDERKNILNIVFFVYDGIRIPLSCRTNSFG